MQLSGARIKISDRGDFMSGTSDRYVSINCFLSSPGCLLMSIYRVIISMYLFNLFVIRNYPHLIAGKSPSRDLKVQFMQPSP